MLSSPTESRREDVAPPHLVRRLVHLASPAFLVYYWIPEDLGHGLSRLSLTLLVFGTAMGIEVVRVALRIPLFGLRGYETERPSAYAWGAAGLFVAFLAFPRDLVIPAFCGMAWIDPLCSWSRRRRSYPWAPGLAYAAVFGLLLSATSLASIGAIRIIVLTAIATASALLAEYPQIKELDDDFLMTVLPLVTTTAASILLRNL